ncbi:MAG: hypothetical protein JXQ75_16650, partial [Phycisphaerae bacterium]|nr:hypothetical protein [Phycisphaerae bacterium]
RENSGSETPFLTVKTTGETPVPQFCHGLLAATVREASGTRLFPRLPRAACPERTWRPTPEDDPRRPASPTGIARILVREPVSAPLSEAMRFSVNTATGSDHVWWRALIREREEQGKRAGRSQPWRKGAVFSRFAFNNI